MNSNPEIHFVDHENIDKQKWDHCITNAANGLVYGYSVYLDTMSDHWDALVMNDYETVMPLTWKRKFGIHYLYQPFQCAQLGVFGNDLSPGIVNGFLKNIPGKFRYIDIFLNAQNHPAVYQEELYQRKNYVLDLNQPYTGLFNTYRENTKRNINKALQARLSLKKDFSVEEVIGRAIPQMRSYGTIRDTDIKKFKNLYGSLHRNGQAMTYGLSDTGNQLLSSCVFFFSNNRAYYILAANAEEGKQNGASHALINEFIKENAGRDMLLDFEGSDTESLAFFYSGFGAGEENYTCFRSNRLPAFLRLLKK